MRPRSLRFLVATAIVLIALGIPLLPISVMAGSSRYFPETGQTSSNAFYDFWLAHGQTEVLGYPVSPVYQGSLQGSATQVVQVYERAIMEWHPENVREQRVQLEQLGAFRLTTYEEETGRHFRAAKPRQCSDAANCETFSATNHTLYGIFRDYWYAHGGVAVFGYPLTEQLNTYDEATDKPQQSQFFERSIFVFDPELNSGSVVLVRLGAGGWDETRSKLKDISASIVQVPDYDSDAPFLPAPARSTTPPIATSVPSKGKYATPPPMTIDPTRKYFATIVTNKGTMTMALNVDAAPITVNNFVFLANEHFYEGVIFHRIVPGFVIQGGDPTGTGTGGPGYKFKDEPIPTNLKYERGTLAMANGGKDTNGSQFFICLRDLPTLPKVYTIFGKVTDGLDVLDAILAVPRVAGADGAESKPTEPIIMQHVTIQVT